MTKISCKIQKKLYHCCMSQKKYLKNNYNKNRQELPNNKARISWCTMSTKEETISVLEEKKRYIIKKARSIISKHLEIDLNNIPKQYITENGQSIQNNKRHDLRKKITKKINTKEIIKLGLKKYEIYNECFENYVDVLIAAFPEFKLNKREFGYTRKTKEETIDNVRWWICKHFGISLDDLSQLWEKDQKKEEIKKKIININWDKMRKLWLVYSFIKNKFFKSYADVLIAAFPEFKLDRDIYLALFSSDKSPELIYNKIKDRLQNSLSLDLEIIWKTYEQVKNNAVYLKQRIIERKKLMPNSLYCKKINQLCWSDYYLFWKKNNSKRYNLLQIIFPTLIIQDIEYSKTRSINEPSFWQQACGECDIHGNFIINNPDHHKIYEFLSQETNKTEGQRLLMNHIKSTKFETTNQKRKIWPIYEKLLDMINKLWPAVYLYNLDTLIKGATKYCLLIDRYTNRYIIATQLAKNVNTTKNTQEDIFERITYHHTIEQWGEPGVYDSIDNQWKDQNQEENEQDLIQLVNDLPDNNPIKQWFIKLRDQMIQDRNTLTEDEYQKEYNEKNIQKLLENYTSMKISEIKKRLMSNSD